MVRLAADGAGTPHAVCSDHYQAGEIRMGHHAQTGRAIRASYGRAAIYSGDALHPARGGGGGV